MIYITISETNSEREKQLGISKENKFSTIIKQLEQYKTDFELGCITYRSLNILLWLFNRMQIVEGNYCSSSAICITDDEEFYEVTNIFSGNKPRTAYQAWLNILYVLNDDIDELFNYSASETDERVVYLRNLLMFLSYLRVYDDEKLFSKHHID